MSFLIKNKEWKDFKEIDIDPVTPYWLKLPNDNIVLAAHIKTPVATGWAVCSLSKKGTMTINTSRFILAHGAKIQEAILSNP